MLKQIELLLLIRRKSPLCETWIHYTSLFLRTQASKLLICRIHLGVYKLLHHVQFTFHQFSVYQVVFIFVHTYWGIFSKANIYACLLATYDIFIWLMLKSKITAALNMKRSLISECHRFFSKANIYIHEYWNPMTFLYGLC